MNRKVIGILGPIVRIHKKNRPVPPPPFGSLRLPWRPDRIKKIEPNYLGRDKLAMFADQPSICRWWEREANFLAPSYNGWGGQKDTMAGGRGHGRGLLAVGRSQLSGSLVAAEKDLRVSIRAAWLLGWLFLAGHIYLWLLYPAKPAKLVSFHLVPLWREDARSITTKQPNTTNPIFGIFPFFFCSLQQNLIMLHLKEARTQSLRCCNI